MPQFSQNRKSSFIQSFDSFFGGHKLFSFFVVLFIALTVPLTVMFALQKTNFSQKAASSDFTCLALRAKVSPSSGTQNTVVTVTASVDCTNLNLPVLASMSCAVTDNNFHLLHNYPQDVRTASTKIIMGFSFVPKNIGLTSDYNINCGGYDINGLGVHINNNLSFPVFHCTDCSSTGGGSGTYYWNECRGNACVNVAHSYNGGSNQCYPAGSTSNNGCSGGGPNYKPLPPTPTPIRTQCNTTGDGKACSGSCSPGQYCESFSGSCNAKSIPLVKVYQCNSKHTYDFKYNQTGTYKNTCQFTCINQCNNCADGSYCSGKQGYCESQTSTCSNGTPTVRVSQCINHKWVFKYNQKGSYKNRCSFSCN